MKNSIYFLIIFVLDTGYKPTKVNLKPVPPLVLYNTIDNSTTAPVLDTITFNQLVREANALANDTEILSKTITNEQNK